MKKIDVILSLITGVGIAGLLIWLMKSSHIQMPLPYLIVLLVIIFPIFSLFCLWIAFLIGKKFIFVFQLAKFLLIGALFAIFDLFILNALMDYFGITEGTAYTIFVAVSFIITTSVKYIADKFWAFEKTEKEQMGAEFGKFFIITVISGVIQVGVASLIVNIIGAQFGISHLVWANIGKIGGIIIASAWNFVCYKFIVFKK